VLKRDVKLQLTDHDSAKRYVLPVFVDDVMFAHNALHAAWLRGRIVKVTHQKAERIFT